MDDAWQVFFAAQVGASAALLGLLFVGVSLNLDKILAGPLLPRRGLLALLLLLLAVLVVGSVTLVPGLPEAALAAALLAAGLSLAALGLSVSLGSWRSPATSRLNIAFGFAMSQLAALPYVAAAVVLLAGGTGAPGWVAAAMILSAAKAVADAWVLLVEINR